MATRYAAAHHRLLTEAQTTAFIAALDHARTAQDVEKAVEQAINSLLVAGLSMAHPDSTVTQDYRHSTDGYITVGSSPKFSPPFRASAHAQRTAFPLRVPLFARCTPEHGPCTRARGDCGESPSPKLTGRWQCGVLRGFSRSSCNVSPA